MRIIDRLNELERVHGNDKAAAEAIDMPYYRWLYIKEHYQQDLDKLGLMVCDSEYNPGRYAVFIDG